MFLLYTLKSEPNQKRRCILYNSKVNQCTARTAQYILTTTKSGYSVTIQHFDIQLVFLWVSEQRHSRLWWVQNSSSGTCRLLDVIHSILTDLLYLGLTQSKTMLTVPGSTSEVKKPTYIGNHSWVCSRTNSRP